MLKKGDSYVTLRHYTNIGCLKSILDNDSLCFSDGMNKGENSDNPWDDQNDVNVIQLYHEKTGKYPYVLCFTHKTSLHHWEYYGKHNDNYCTVPIDDIKCCIIFDYKKIIQFLENLKKSGLNIEWDCVNYVSASKLLTTHINDDKLVFTKKLGFGVDEEERVVLYSPDDLSKNSSLRSLNGIKQYIKEIVVYKNGKTNQKVYEDAINFLRVKYPYIKINTSALTNSEKWLSNLKIANNINNQKKFSTMKTKLFTLLFAIVTSAGTVFADRVQIGDLYYNLDTMSYTAKVTSSPGKYSGSVTIPASVLYDNKTYSVTYIGDYAFTGCTGLTSVTIPNSVTSIGDNAFYECSGLTSVTIPNSVTSIGWWAFRDCTGLISIEIPNSVTSIGVTAFCNCTSLTSIEIPNSVTSIEERVFESCTGLTFVEIPNSVTSIGAWAFRGCTGLTSIEIPNSVTSIGNGAFSSCGNLKSVTINSNDIVSNTISTNNIKSIFGAQVEEYILGVNIKNIGRYAFSQCDSLASVTIGDSITSIESNAFAACAKLNSVIWNAKRCDDFTNYSPFYPSNIKSFTFGNEVEKIPAYLCSRLDSITNIVIPNSVTSIGDRAFEYCNNLTSITIPNNVIHIGDYVLYGCTGLTHPVYNASYFVYLPVNYSGGFAIQNGITTICGGAFSACSGLTSISIPNSVINIGESAFRNCTSLTSIEIPNSVTTIGNNAFSFCNNLISIVIPQSVQNCTWRVLLHNEKLKNVEAPTWFFDVAESIWANCPKYLHSVTINDGEINDNVFGVISRSYKTLTNLNIANATNTNIADEAFKGYYNLTTLALPTNLEYIGYMAVAECVKLQSVTIPASVTEIDDRAFENCRSLETITFGGQSAGALRRFNAPSSSESELQRIGNWAFYNCHELQNLEIPEGVTEIGDGAFYGCVYLEDLSLPASVQSIGDNTFALCAKLQKIVVNAVTPPTIQTKTFYDVKRQIPVYVPDESVSAYENDVQWGEFNIQGIANMPTDIDQIMNDEYTNNCRRTKKILRNGQILILRGDKSYTLTGQEVR